jgi:carboxylesterase 2
VFGHSAGGASTDLLSISPHSRDLFKNAAPMAGSSFCNWATTRPQRTLKKATNLAKKRGFKSTNKGTEYGQNAELIAFLRQLPADRLKVAAHGIPTLGNVDAIQMHVAPVFDGDFFSKPLDELRKEAPPRNVLTGITSFEGLMFGASGKPLEKIAKTFIGTYLQDRNETAINKIFNRLVPPQRQNHDKHCVEVCTNSFVCQHFLERFIV